MDIYNAPIITDCIIINTSGIDINLTSHLYSCFLFENKSTETIYITINTRIIKLDANKYISFIQDAVSIINIKASISTAQVFYVIQGYRRLTSNG